MSSAKFVKDQLEIEACLDFSEEVSTSSMQPRWKRKALTTQQQMVSPPRSAQKRSRARTPHKTPSHDRFIPNRAAMDLSNAHFNLMKENSSMTGNESPSRTEFNKTLADNMGASTNRVLAFKEKAPAPKEGYENSMRILYTQNKTKITKTIKPNRYIPSAPERILDAPDLLDDYYLNLVDWGVSNVLAVALGQSVYLWNAETGGIDELFQCEAEDDYITSVKFVQEGGGYLAVGTNFCETQLWDIEHGKKLRSMHGHEARVSSLSWNQHILSSGSRDSTIVHHDVRIQNDKVGVLAGHRQEVCGLSWSPDGSTLASGGNDNLLCIWDARFCNERGPSQNIQAPRLTITDHCAAVKALAWCPHQRNVLASGGGTADRTIKIWNAANAACLNSVDTGSQVCSLLWNPHEKELLSSHGFSQNQLCLWKYPSMVKVKELSGHTARVLHMTPSPDGTLVCSAAADETLRFWKVFEAVKSAKSTTPRKTISGSQRAGLDRMSIR